MSTFAETVADMTLEYISSGGGVTCEVAIKDWQPQTPVLVEASRSLAPLGARWVVADCEVCQDHHGPEYKHVSIEPFSLLFAPGLLFDGGL